MPTTYRFESSMRHEVARSAAIAAASLAVLLAIVYWEDGGWPPSGLLVVLVGLMGFIFLLPVLATWRRGLRWVEVGPEAVRISRRTGERVVRWADLVGYQHYRGRSESWQFDLADGHRVAFVVEGFHGGEDVRLSEAIAAGLVARGLADRAADGRLRRSTTPRPPEAPPRGAGSEGPAPDTAAPSPAKPSAIRPSG
ncbi:MAG: hypothetical protein AAF845_01355 [Bacteroidota bacterium]